MTLRDILTLLFLTVGLTTIQLVFEVFFPKRCPECRSTSICSDFCARRGR